MYYWRAAVKHKDEKSYTLVYFATQNIDDAGDVVEFLESYELQSRNSYLRHLNKLEFISNILLAPVATMNTFQNYNRAVLIG